MDSPDTHCYRQGNGIYTGRHPPENGRWCACGLGQAHPGGTHRSGAYQLLPHQRPELHLPEPYCRGNGQPAGAEQAGKGKDGGTGAAHACRIRGTHGVRCYGIHRQGAGQDLFPYGAYHPHSADIRGAHHLEPALPVPHHHQSHGECGHSLHLLLPVWAGDAVVFLGRDYHLAEPGDRQYHCNDRPHPPEA